MIGHWFSFSIESVRDSGEEVGYLVTGHEMKSMTAYRFRVKLERAPTALWRDIVIGGERTLDELQAAFNDAVGLNQDHLWFFGSDQDYWQSIVKYQRSEEYEDLPSGGPMRFDEEVYNAGETSIDEMIEQLELEERDRICYLFDYGDEWRFYAILKEVRPDAASDIPPDVVKQKADPVILYPSLGEEHRYR